MKRLRAPTATLARIAAMATAAVVLAAVFASYFRPTLAFDLASRLWSCL